MKRTVLLFILTAALALAAPASADVFLLGFTGFDYDSALATSTHYLDVGDQYHSLGVVTSVNTGLLPYVDMSVNQYTYYMNNLYVASVPYWDLDILFVDFSNLSGRTRYYEDPIGNTPGVYGTNPANGTAPSTFVDGVIALGGKTYNFSLSYTFSSGQGDFGGYMDLDEGTQLSGGYIPTSQLNGWILGGLSGNGLSGPPNPSVPAGYDHQVEGSCRRPSVTPATHKTWGAIKALYR